MDKELLQEFVGSSVEIRSDTGKIFTGKLTKIVGDQVILSNPKSIVKAETIDSVEELDNGSEAAESVDASSEPTNPVEYLAEIEQRFNAEVNQEEMRLKVPDFKFPAADLPGWQNTSYAFLKWQAIQCLHNDATNGDYSSPKSDKIKDAISELEFLALEFPHSATLKRYLCYFHSLSGNCNWNEALEYYLQFAIESEQASHWFDVAVCALKVNKVELACYSLERFFDEGSMCEELSAWYIYANLLGQFNNLTAFRNLCEADGSGIAEGRIEVLLESAIFLLTKKDKKEQAVNILRRWLNGEYEKSLLDDACSALDGQPTKSYQDFRTKFVEEMMSREKKPVSETLKPREYAPIEKKRGITKKKSEPQPKVARNETREEKELFDNAKRAADSGAPERAKELFKELIEKGIRVESAYKDLANVYFRLGEANEAVKILADEKNRGDAKNKSAWDRLLIQAYGHAGAYKDMIPLLKQFIDDTTEPQKQAPLRQQIADAYMKLGEYENATEQFRKVSNLRPDNADARKKIVYCLAKQNKYTLAREILNELQVVSPDADSEVSALSAEITEAETTGREFDPDDAIARGIETELLYFSGELDEFAQFFLDRSKLADLVQAGRLNDDGNYVGSEEDSKADIHKLVALANQHRTRTPAARSIHYLCAARILSDVGDFGVSFYRYLCRSFASRGDAAIFSNLDVARAWYCEALAAYDQAVNIQRVYEQDSVNSIVKYLYSTLGSEAIPLAPRMSTAAIKSAAKNVISEKGKASFHEFCYLLCRSDYAKDQVLKVLYDDIKLRQPAMDYLRKNGVAIPDEVPNQHDFCQFWYALCRTKSNRLDEISKQLQTLRNFEFTTIWLENNIQRIDSIVPELYLELDKRHVGELRQIIETSLDFGTQDTAEGQIDLCGQLDHACSVELNSIMEQPTKLSVTSIYPTIEVIRKKADEHREWIHENLKPELTLRLPEGMTYTPLEGKIEVQIVVENAEGRNAADGLKLVAQPEESLFTLTVPENQPRSVRGGNQEILRVELHLTQKARESRGFSLRVHAEYYSLGTREDERETTDILDVSIQTDSNIEFQTINNPYEDYARGDVVEEGKMFFGRKKLINKIAQKIRSARGYRVLVYGQYRSGKTSVLYHLIKELNEDKKENENVLVLNFGEMDIVDPESTGKSADTGSAGDGVIEPKSTKPDSTEPISHQILNKILRLLSDAICSRLPRFNVPNESAIYINPYDLFETTFTNLREAWENARGEDLQTVLMIDEFQYLYDLIVGGEVREDFMQKFRRLLEKNHISAVMAGQHVMSKFQNRLPNAFKNVARERVSYLDDESARRLIIAPVEFNGGSRFLEQSVQRILDLTAGNAFYIQKICSLLVVHMNEERTNFVTEADVEQVKNRLISGDDKLVYSEFHSMTKSSDSSDKAISEDDAKEVLTAIAVKGNPVTEECRASRINCKTDSSVKDILKDLEEREVLERVDKVTEKAYRIRVRLFKEWLKKNN